MAKYLCSIAITIYLVCSKYVGLSNTLIHSRLVAHAACNSLGILMILCIITHGFMGHALGLRFLSNIDILITCVFTAQLGHVVHWRRYLRSCACMCSTNRRVLTYLELCHEERRVVLGEEGRCREIAATCVLKVAVKP